MVRKLGNLYRNEKATSFSMRLLFLKFEKLIPDYLVAFIRISNFLKAELMNSSKKIIPDFLASFAETKALPE